MASGLRRQPRVRTMTAVEIPTVARRTRNLHPIGDDGIVTFCGDDDCERCSDFAFLESRADREFGCALVRLDATAAEGDNNDDEEDDADQPTIREDNESFNMICELEGERDEFQGRVCELEARARDAAAETLGLRMEVARLRLFEQSNVLLKRELYSLQQKGPGYEQLASETQKIREERDRLKDDMDRQMHRDAHNKNVLRLELNRVRKDKEKLQGELDSVAAQKRRKVAKRKEKKQPKARPEAAKPRSRARVGWSSSVEPELDMKPPPGIVSGPVGACPTIEGHHGGDAEMFIKEESPI